MIKPFKNFIMTFDSHRDLAIPTDQHRDFALPRVDSLAQDCGCPCDEQRCFDPAEQSNFQVRKLSVSNQLHLDYPRAIQAAV